MVVIRHRAPRNGASRSRALGEAPFPWQYTGISSGPYLEHGRLWPRAHYGCPDAQAQAKDGKKTLLPVSSHRPS